MLLRNLEAKSASTAGPSTGLPPRTPFSSWNLPNNQVALPPLGLHVYVYCFNLPLSELLCSLRILFPRHSILPPLSIALTLYLLAPPFPPDLIPLPASAH